MLAPRRAAHTRAAVALAALVAATLVMAGPTATPARAVELPNPCDAPGLGTICDVVGDTAGAVTGAAGDFVMKGVTTWVTNAAVWVTGKVGGLVEATTSPDLQAGWFEGQYGAMIAVAGALALLMLLLAVIQAVLRQDVWLLLRSAFGYLPMAFVLAAVAIAGTQLLIWITDDLSSTVAHGLGSQADNSLLNQVGDAYKHALDDNSGDAVPLFGIFLGAIILAIGAFVLWLELIIRDAAIYICVFFLPLTFVAMIWPATGRWARRLVELLVAIVLSKFVIVAILTLATAAITSTVSADSQGFEKMLAGAALLVLAAWSPFALLRLIPMMEVAAHSIGGQRSAVGQATSAAGIHTPAAYMRQAMERQSHSHSSYHYAATTGSARPAGDWPSARASGSTGAGATGGRTDTRSSQHTGDTRTGRPEPHPPPSTQRRPSVDRPAGAPAPQVTPPVDPGHSSPTTTPPRPPQGTRQPRDER